jgi:general secretion pathway protein B
VRAATAAAPPSAAKPTATAANVPQAPEAPLLNDLAPDLRRQIPALAVSGAVYSNNPGQRLLLINGQVLTQGSQAAPGITLEEIREHSAVFNFQGTRFRLAH